MEEEKKILPTPPKELNQNRQVPPPPPNLKGDNSNAQNETLEISKETNAEKVQLENVQKEEDISKTEENSTDKQKVKKEMFWNRKPVLWSGIALGIALVAVVVFCIVAL